MHSRDFLQRNHIGKLNVRLIYEPSVLAELIYECIDSEDVRVLCVLGETRSGKTRGIQQWLNDPSNKFGATSAYINCQGLAFNNGNAVETLGHSSTHAEGHYPMFDLNGIEVVVIDEAQMDAELVNRLIAHTSKVRSAYSHTLLILITQTQAALERFNLPANETRISFPTQAV